MTSRDPDVPPLEEPLAELERLLIDEYARGVGQDPESLRQRNDPIAKKILAAASQYAALKLTEVESRAHYILDLHDGRR